MDLGEELKEKQYKYIPANAIESHLKKMEEDSVALEEFFQSNSSLYRKRMRELQNDTCCLLEKEEEVLLEKSKLTKETSITNAEARTMDLSALYSSIEDLLEKLDGRQKNLQEKEQLTEFSKQLYAIAGYEEVYHTNVSPLQLRKWKGRRHFVKPVSESLMFDPLTAHPNLVLSRDQKQVRFESYPVRKYSKDCFQPGLYVLGSPGFQSGRHYWEVDVGNKSSWVVGVVRESVERKSEQHLGPINGYWVIRKQKDNVYFGLGPSPTSLKLPVWPIRIGVCLDLFSGCVSFYDADTANMIFELADCSVGEKMFPFFCPGIPTREEDWGPLILCT
ncbi:hypothetical protein GDO86_014275 [Hymenochirus boettgeri]|uniref:B30.2/SPRY domain-containing protein n=1 Tax=Hymenochirus boettgeri TaxID=247094 RepID=A0A8T2JNG7_9PIPI|nr:hypothetical protein GDO86_014275 [Hymenochirus boettgeri]